MVSTPRSNTTLASGAALMFGLPLDICKVCGLSYPQSPEWWSSSDNRRRESVIMIVMEFSQDANWVQSSGFPVKGGWYDHHNA
jgi:hypothetical protein